MRHDPPDLDHGSPILLPLEIRPIEPGDKADLASALKQSSSEAINRRFLALRGPLSAAELRYLTEVDHHDHEALVAVDPESGRGVASLATSVTRSAAAAPRSPSPCSNPGRVAGSGRR